MQCIRLNRTVNFQGPQYHDCHICQLTRWIKFCFVTDEESFEDADGEEGEYHLGGDASILSHSKGFVLDVLVI
jgi:hypothetical protein